MKNIFVSALLDALIVSVLALILALIVGVVMYFVPGMLVWFFAEGDIYIVVAGGIFGVIIRFVSSFVKSVYLANKLTETTQIEFDEAAALVCKFRYISSGEQIENIDHLAFRRDYNEYKRRGLI